MDGLCRYMICVVAAALLSGILTRLTQRCSSGEIVRMLCGIFMTIVLIQPMIGGKELILDSELQGLGKQAEAISEEGTAEAENLRKEFIKQRVEAYISNRAETIGAEIQASVSLGEDCVPVSVRITGKISPLNRSRLAQVIVSELGIPREQQEWIG